MKYWYLLFVICSTCAVCCPELDYERSLLSAGLDIRACERKGGTADNTSRNEIRVAHTKEQSINICFLSDTVRLRSSSNFSMQGRSYGGGDLWGGRG